MTTRYFGTSVGRREDYRLLTGAGQYVDDLGQNALAAAFVRAPIAHARILNINVDDALDVDGLVAIYTWSDLPATMAEGLPLIIPHPAVEKPKTGPVLARDVVRHVGEPIAMVVARDRYLAEDVVERIDVSYDPLPAVAGLDHAERAVSLVHADVPGNVAARLVEEVGDVDAALADAPHLLEFDLRIERSASMPLEGRGVYARRDAEDEVLRVYSSTQAPAAVRMALSVALRLPEERIACIAPDVGGGFGVKVVYPWPEELLVPWASILLGADIKWAEDRREHFIASAHEREQRQHVRVGFDEQGRLLGLDVQLRHDTGAYTPLGVVVPLNSATHLPGPYKHPSYRVEITSFFTNTVQVAPYRGAGRPQGCFAMERTLDRIASHLDLDRAEVRARNLIGPNDMPYHTGLEFPGRGPVVYDSGDYPALLTKLKQLIDWEGASAFREAAAQEGRRVGVGIACYVEGTGVGPYEGGHVEVETNGRVNVYTGLSSQGQGHATVFAQIVADALNVPIDNVYVTTGDTRRFPYAVGTFASRAAVVSGNAIAAAARKVREKALAIAAEGLEANPADLEIVDGIVQVKGSPGDRIPLSTVAVLANPLRYAFDDAARAAAAFKNPEGMHGWDFSPGLEAREYYGPQRWEFTSGMHAALVETDPATAEVRILRYAVIHDCGTIINPRIVEGQIHGGVAQGIGGALYEQLVYDEHGQLVNSSFMDFLMPYATEIPHIDVDHLETPSPLNPLGVKGAGEAGVIPVSAALAAAIEDAEGIIIDSMPLSPSDLFRLRMDRN